MLKAKLIMLAVKTVMVLSIVGLGIWYLSSSIGGAAITYTSVDNFLTATGVKDGNLTTSNACFMCKYVMDMFSVIGNATEKFWNLMVDHIWILAVMGFGIFLFIHTAQHIFEAAKSTAKLDAADKKLGFKVWFDKVWKLGARVLVVGALLGMLGAGGTHALKVVANVTITPVMYAGSALATAATGINKAAHCGPVVPAKDAQGKTKTDYNDILNPILQPFMCVVSNINSVMLAGAAGGFALMNYSWLGLGGGAFTWLAGLMLVLMFLVIGFDLFFQILSVIFKLVFVIIFLPLLLAAAAFDKTWAKASGLLSNSMGMVVSSAVRIVAITLKVIIMYAVVAYTADSYFPGPNDGYSAILPPLIGETPENPDAQTMSVMQAFSTCESQALVNGEMDREIFKTCFNDQKATIESTYPDAFDFMDDGWDFTLTMLFLFFLYFYAISPKVDKILPNGAIKMPIPGEKSDVSSKEEFDYGAWVHDVGKKAWAIPIKLTEKITNSLTAKD